jgi:valyl-tRNA synthetase
VPLINRRIPIIADDYVEMDFGTGALKVTPAHDMNDYQLGLKYNLAVIDTMNDDGTMSEAAQLYIGEDRFDVRKKIVHDLEAAGHIVKIEDYTNQIGFSERTDTVVEPRLSMQWWLAMKKISEPALKAVTDGNINFHPAKFKNTYKYWMENIRDWCISRQLWWGHRIPAWYLPDGNFAVAETKEEAWDILSEKLKVKSEELSNDPQSAIRNLQSAIGSRFTMDDLRQDDDVLDTWFSAWLWPFETFKGFSNPGNTDIQY